MTNAALLVLAGLLVLAYLLDVLGRQIKLPSVVLLIATGMAGRQVFDRLGWTLGFVDEVLPLVGTVGLILIVLEGTLDLELRRERARLIAMSSTVALLGFLGTLFAFTLMMFMVLGYELKVAALAAMPFAVISSAVAIPSAHGLEDAPREFVVYESALSDIIGVLVFYAWLAADGSIGVFTEDLLGGGALSLVAAALVALLLFYLLNRIEGHVRFVPLLAGLMLLYAVGKVLHLSPLVLVLVCGLLLNNPHLLERSRWLRALHGKGYDRTLAEFKGLVAELTFATKSVFFILLGYWTDVHHMLDWRAWAMATAMFTTIYASRAMILGLLEVGHVRQLLWIAPRALITVLLFLAAIEAGSIVGFPFGAVMLVVMSTAMATALAHRGQPAAGDDSLSDAGDRPAGGR